MALLLAVAGPAHRSLEPSLVRFGALWALANVATVGGIGLFLLLWLGAD